MKIAASYISSLYDYKKTIKLLEETEIDFLHVDLMDGKYVLNKNFTKTEIVKLLSNVKKPLQIHLMVDKPEKYLDLFATLNTEVIIIHPDTCKNVLKTIEDIKNLGIKVGIAINPEEEIDKFLKLYAFVDEVLVMSVKPGQGGQEFMESVLPKITKLNELKEKYNFLIAVDGGINDETLKLLSNVDIIVSGSFICQSNDYNEQVKSLKK